MLRRRCGFPVVFLTLMICAFFTIVVSAQDENVAPQRQTQPIEVMAVQIEEGSDPDATSLVILVSRSVEPKIFSIGDPSRLIVDIKNAYANRNLPSQIATPNPNIIRTVRIGEHEEEGFVRFVCDLFDDKKYDVTPRLYVPKGENSGAKLVITLKTAESEE